MPTSARWEVANSPQITVKTVHSARADVGIGPNASVHVDSFHDYELCILAKYLRQIPQFASDLDDAFIEEHGLTVLMDVVRSLPPLDTPYVPRDSIVREFVGGSIFQY